MIRNWQNYLSTYKVTKCFLRPTAVSRLDSHLRGHSGLLTFSKLKCPFAQIMWQIHLDNMVSPNFTFWKYSTLALETVRVATTFSLVLHYCQNLSMLSNLKWCHCTATKNSEILKFWDRHFQSNQMHYNTGNFFRERNKNNSPNWHVNVYPFMGWPIFFSFLRKSLPVQRRYYFSLQWQF